jgi:hypothetical protein
MTFWDGDGAESSAEFLGVMRLALNRLADLFHHETEAHEFGEYQF